jgi:hypothetical protein
MDSFCSDHDLKCDSSARKTQFFFLECCGFMRHDVVPYVALPLAGITLAFYSCISQISVCLTVATAMQFVVEGVQSDHRQGVKADSVNFSQRFEAGGCQWCVPCLIHRMQVRLLHNPCGDVFLLGNVQHFYPSCAFLSVKALTGA